METNESTDTSNSNPRTAHRGSAHLLKRVCTGYEKRLTVRGFKGEPRRNSDLIAIIFTNDVGDEVYIASFVGGKRDTTRRGWMGFVGKLCIENVCGTA
jgi:hypothetical protein